ncbi:hypothetical protein AK830_g7744 [Neonectria ditissima]|uniref:Gfd2/YDR514C-like C-terminal domain-containing protein n=1 Tax=Neonectria ditissima TaxID=78410 RepID=A0A0P7BE50_9HYPO|nr:hypothetical protein AK830_g7744 [Neonectria ditissima]
MGTHYFGETPWYSQPGLCSEHQVASVPPYDCGKLRARAPEAVAGVLPMLAPPHIKNLYSNLPKTEYLIISLDFEQLCRSKVGRYADGREYSFKPLTEVGISCLDMRDVIRGRGRKTHPGDRGSSWFRFMTPLHYMIDEYKDHWGHICQSDWLHAEPYHFAFGTTKAVPERCIANRLQNLFISFQKRNRTAREIKENEVRQILFLTFDSTLAEKTLSRLGLSWLTRRNVQIWDIQRDLQLELRFSWPKMRFEYVMEALGLRFEDSRFGNLSHCAGNAAVFIIQVFLALFYKSYEQSVAFAARHPVPWLRYTWVGHALDQTNVAPGDSARRREQNQMNRHEVPQRRDVNAFF